MADKRENASALPSTILGRPQIEIDYDLLRMLAQRGVTQEEACPFLKISYTTFKRHMRDDVRFRTTWEEGRAAFRLSLRELQIWHASKPGPAGVAMTIHISKHQLGETDKSVVEHANKDGKPLEVKAVEPTEYMGVNLAKASPEALAALEVVAAEAARQAAENAFDIIDMAIEE